MAEDKLWWVKIHASETLDTLQNLVVGGLELGHPIYVIRASHGNGLIPGKLVSNLQDAYVPFGGEEHHTNEYEVLLCPAHALSWVRSTGTNIPDHAVVGGTDPSGDLLYIGRAKTHGSLICGKIHANSGICYVPYYGEEHAFDSYEILVRNEYGLALHV